MCRIIDQLASERGIKPDDAAYIFTGISAHLVNKIPALKEVIEDVFADEADDKLQEDISKAVILLQQHTMKAFLTWHMPNQSVIRQQGSDEILYLFMFRGSGFLLRGIVADQFCLLSDQ